MPPLSQLVARKSWSLQQPTLQSRGKIHDWSWIRLGSTTAGSAAPPLEVSYRRTIPPKASIGGSITLEAIGDRSAAPVTAHGQIRLAHGCRCVPPLLEDSAPRLAFSVGMAAATRPGSAEPPPPSGEVWRQAGSGRSRERQEQEVREMRSPGVRIRRQLAHYPRFCIVLYFSSSSVESSACKIAIFLRVSLLLPT